MTDYRDPLRNTTYPDHSGVSAAELRAAGPIWAVLIGALVVFGLLIYAFGGRDLPTGMTNQASPPAATQSAPTLPTPRTPTLPSAPSQ